MKTQNQNKLIAQLTQNELQELRHNYYANINRNEG